MFTLQNLSLIYFLFVDRSAKLSWNVAIKLFQKLLNTMYLNVVTKKLRCDCILSSIPVQTQEKS